MIWAGWKTRSIGSFKLGLQESSLRSLVGFGWFSLIRAENRSPFVFLDSESFRKILENFESLSQ